MTPDKPTRERAKKTSDPRGRSAGADRDAPHATGDADQESIQGNDRDAPTPVLPANAQGTDRVSTTDAARPINPESMYDDRPSQDKDRPPSDG